MTIELSVVTTMYYSSPYLEEFYRQVSDVSETITSDYEIVFVNDASPDNSMELALSLYDKDHRVRVFDLSRNFGHHRAMMTGLAHAKGDLVFLIDCDLEVKPNVLVDFYKLLHEKDVDVVYGVRKTRQDPWADQLFGRLFYTIFNMLSDIQLPINLTTARLMTRRYVEALVAHQERELLIGGLWVITGFKQLGIPVDKQFKGSSTYKFGHKIAIIVDAITSFSNKPLVFIFYMGCFISFVSFVSALYLIIQLAFFSVFLMGWPSLIVSIWLLGGINIMCLGVIGIYLSKIFIETKQRPYTIIRKIYERA